MDAIELFVKYLDNEAFNVTKGCKTLKIQTLENCKELEGKRQDLSESSLKSFIRPGRYENKPLVLPGASIGGNQSKILIGGEFSVTESFNAYLYSVSLIKQEESTLKFGKERFGEQVCDFFCFSTKYAKIFADLIGLELQSQLRLNDFQERSQKVILANGGIEKILIQWIINPVTYLDLKDLETSDGIPDYDKRMIRLIFCKPREMFYGDREFRFVWVPIITVNNEYIPLQVHKEPKIIALPLIRYF